MFPALPGLDGTGLERTGLEETDPEETDDDASISTKPVLLREACLVVH